MENSNENLLARIKLLEDQMAAFHNSTLIPYEVGNAFAERLGAVNAQSTGTFGSIDHSVAVSGGAVTVLRDPDGFVKVLFRGITYKLAYWTD